MFMLMQTIASLLFVAEHEPDKIVLAVIKLNKYRCFAICAA